MEEARLIDPGFWTGDMPEAPGSELPPVQGELPGLVFFQTSGSTGAAKWIGLSREALLLSAAVVNRHLQVSESDTWGLVLPLHHVGGFGVVARAFESGSRLARYEERWDPVGAVRWIARNEVAHCPMVPTQVHDLMKAGLPAPACLKSVVVGGGMLTEELGRAARSLGWPVLASYGMTEAGSQIATQSLEVLEKPYVTGPIEVLPHWRVTVPESGRLRIAGPALFSGMIVASNDGPIYRARIGEEFETSDRVELSAEGLRVLGRADQRVKVLGELVDLDAIEASLGGDLAVLAIPDERRGSRLVAAGTDPQLQVVVEDYNASVAGPWRIVRAVNLERLPRTDLGKLDRATLAQWLRES